MTAKKKAKKSEPQGEELRRQFYLIAVTGLIIGKLLSTTQTRKPRKKFKKRDYFSPQQYLYRRRIKKAQRWARYGTQSWLKEKWRRTRNQLRGNYYG